MNLKAVAPDRAVKSANSKISQQTLSLAFYDTRVFYEIRGRWCAREYPLQVSNFGVKSSHSLGCWMSDEGSAAFAGNTSHRGRGRRQYNHPQSRPRMELSGKALHQWHTLKDSHCGEVVWGKDCLQCCSKERDTHVYVASL